jgi:hypothetical protein
VLCCGQGRRNSKVAEQMPTAATTAKADMRNDLPKRTLLSPIKTPTFLKEKNAAG